MGLAIEDWHHCLQQILSLMKGFVGLGVLKLALLSPAPLASVL